MTNHQAQFGTRCWAAMFLCIVAVGCSKSTASKREELSESSCEPTPCPSRSPWSREHCACTPEDAGAPEPECQVNTDCTVTHRGCCGTCLPPDRENAVAVSEAKLGAVRKELCPNPSTCGSCYVSDPDPLAPLFVAACIEQRCELVDLREDDISKCESDSDCSAQTRGCCPSSSEAPVDYVGLHHGADRSELLACFPAPGCPPPPAHELPIAFCASDAHCAVRRSETLRGERSKTCYSPTQNLDRASDPDAVGCDCVPGSLALCRTNSAGERVGLTCQDNDHWQKVENGPCKKP